MDRKNLILIKVIFILSIFLFAAAVLASNILDADAAELNPDSGLSITGKIFTGTNTAPGIIRNDFDGDLDSDILAFRGDGSLSFVPLDATNWTGFEGIMQLDLNAGWTVNSTTDINGDNNSDLFLFNKTTGDIRFVFLSGSTVLSDTIVANLDKIHGLNLMGASDFNGDGRAEILAFNPITGHTYLFFFDSSRTFSSSEEILQIDVAAGWELLDTADFNGDGNTDLLTFNETTGEAAVTLLDGSTVLASNTIITIDPSEQWTIQETGDFDGDGNDDLVYLHQQGHLLIVTVDGTTLTGQYIPGGILPGWKIINAGKYNDDEMADLLAFDTLTGNVIALLQDGTTVTSLNNVLNVGVASGWKYLRGKPFKNIITVPPAAIPESGFKIFLEQTTWGPTDHSLDHVKTVGKMAFLQEQFAATPSTYPEVSTDSNSLNPLRQAFFYNAFNGDDQLRQRMAFALSQLFVVSANKVSNDYQMIPYIKMLHSNAFGNFYDLMVDVTLSPTMGDFLDMVNNDKPKPEIGLNPNENYARELLQLFTIGLNELNLDGSEKTDSNGDPIPTFSEDVILNLSRVFTGWTYPTLPGIEPIWTNPRNYDGPMVAIEERHDTDPKNLMNGFQIPGDQTAREDLDQALTHIFNHPNVGPFVATRLIRNLVTSNPGPAYIARVANVFNSNENGVRGDLKSVLKAIFTDPEAAKVHADGGHLREPILFANALLRALGATVGQENALYNNTKEMGQVLFSPPSVFNHFSPLHKPTGLDLFGPEFQIHTQSATFSRANFVDKVVNSNLGDGINVDLSDLESISDDLALVQAVEAMLLHESLSTTERNSIIAAISVPNISGPTRVRVAVYLIAVSSRFQVQH